jgi:hypothetical protein
LPLIFVTSGGLFACGGSLAELSGNELSCLLEEKNAENKKKRLKTPSMSLASI